MSYELEAKPATDREPPALIELRRLAEVTESLDQRVEMLARRLDMVLEPEEPTPSPNGVKPEAPTSSPLINEMRHLAADLHRIEGRLAGLFARIQV